MEVVEHKVPIFLEPGQTAEKVRALVRRIYEASHEPVEDRELIANMSLLAGVSCAYLLDYAKLLEQREQEQAAKDPANASPEVLKRAAMLYVASTANGGLAGEPFRAWGMLSTEEKSGWVAEAQRGD